MKKVITTAIASNIGMPIKSGTLNHLQEAYREEFAAMLAVFNNGTALSGISVLSGVTNTGSGANYIISAGIVFYNGEYFEVDATTFTAADTAVATIVTTYVTAANADPVLFTDGVNRNVHAIRKIAIIDGNTSSPNYIDDFDTFIYLCTDFINITTTDDGIHPFIVSGMTPTAGASRLKYKLLPFNRMLLTGGFVATSTGNNFINLNSAQLTPGRNIYISMYDITASAMTYAFLETFSGVNRISIPCTNAHTYVFIDAYICF